MKIVTFYEAQNCGTCAKAQKFLLNRRYAMDRIDILKQPPTEAQVRQMIGFYKGRFTALFNTTSSAYARIADQVPLASEAEVTEHLIANPHLFKRPFVLFEGKGLVGFNETEWNALFPA